MVANSLRGNKREADDPIGCPKCNIIEELTCECGRPKVSRSSSMCRWCLFLDNGLGTHVQASGGKGSRDIIDALRDGAETLAELQTATGRDKRSLDRSLRNLIKYGRIRGEKLESNHTAGIWHFWLSASEKQVRR